MIHSPKAVLVFSKECHLLFVRCTVPKWLLQDQHLLVKALDKAAKSHLEDPKYKSRFVGGVRGDHAVLIWGYWRQSMFVSV